MGGFFFRFGGAGARRHIGRPAVPTMVSHGVGERPGGRGGAARYPRAGGPAPAPGHPGGA
ncbi:hypothetical protein [Streptomyces sp. NPDC097640]|uniref:hypothetical protein n=1 Tax=Streptomyces sp. NPDC097640 TaxID=3157229 RepID=UPI00331914D2